MIKMIMIAECFLIPLLFLWGFCSQPPFFRVMSTAIFVAGIITPLVVRVYFHEILMAVTP